MPISLEDLQLKYGFTDEEAEEVRQQLAPEGLRNKLAEAQAQAKKVPELEAKVQGLEQGPKRIEALKEAGFDTESLSPAAKDALAAKKFEGEEPTAEELKAFGEYHGLAAAQASPAAENGEEKPPAAGVTNFSKEAPNGPDGGGTLIKPEEATNWSVTDMARFRQQHPEAWNELLKGNEVSAAFTPSG